MAKNTVQNIRLPVPANQIDTVFLTRTHSDHSGMWPKLYKDGFQGALYAAEGKRPCF